MKKILLFLFLFTSLTFYSQIQAVDDYFNLPLAETMGGTTPSVLENDLLNDLDLSDIKIITYSAPMGFSMNQDGTITVKAGTTPGIYNFIYSVCEKSIICGNNATITINTINATPISDLITDCGSGYFDLTKQNLLLIGNLNPNEAVISYHLSFADAIRGTNAITNPEKYSIRVDEQIIYTRINNAGSISINYFYLVPSYISITSEIRSPTGSLQIGGMIYFSISHAIYPLRVELMNTNFNVISSRIYEAKRGATIYDLYDNLFPGVYFINVIDKNDCSSSFPFNIAESPLNFTTTVIGKTMTVNATGGIPPYQYIIDNQLYTNNVFSRLSVGSHILEVRDSNMYQISGLKVIVTIEEPTALYATTTSSNINCYGDNNGSITINATGGNSPYMYSKDGSNYTENNTFNNLIEGIYTTYVKDADGIIVSNISTITQPATPLSFTTTTKEARCTNNGSITINAIGGDSPYTYSQDGINYDSNNILSDLGADTYTLYVKDANGCISIQEVILYSLKDIWWNPILSVTNVSCNGGNDGSILLDTDNKSAGTYTYKINGGTPQTGNVISGLSAGTYFIGITNSNAGCGTIIQITIIEPTAPLSFTTTATGVTCLKKGSITITATGGSGPYTYSIDSVNYDSTAAFSDLLTDTYTVSVKDSNGCVSTKLVQLYNRLDISFYTSVTNVSCNGGNDGSILIYDVVAEDDDSYTYQIDNGTPQSDNTFSGLSAGSYYIQVTDSNSGCGAIVQITITEPPTVLKTTTSISNVTCSGANDGWITASVNGGMAPYFYSIDGGNYVDSGAFYKLYAGTHSITAKDSNGNCSVINNLIITEPAPLSATIVIENQNIIINATGGTGSYTYSIHPGTDSYPPNNNIFSNLYPEDNYYITVLDENKCRFAIDGIVINPPAPLINDQKALAIDFTMGQTLADLTVDGQNIKWYSNQNPLAGKTSKTNEVTLPLTTVLIDGVTYYASQTINGVESIERLAVTVKLNKTLSTPDFILPNFTYYPNPVKHILTINNTSMIDEIEVYSVSGASVLSKRIDSVHAEIDLSNVASGFYFLKVKSEGQVKIVKLVKK